MPRYRLYIDESGDHTYHNVRLSEKRYLGLTGVIIEAEHYRESIHPDLERLKQEHFPHNPDEPVILHRNEIVSRYGPFWRLREEERKTRWNEGILQFLDPHRYVLVTVVLDKMQHQQRYQERAIDPYLTCLRFLLESYGGLLTVTRARGDVMAESRGGNEDRQLKAAYQGIWNNGTQRHPSDWFQGVLTSREIKLKRKAENIAGLQVADLLAYPSKKEVLVEQQRVAPEELSRFDQEIVRVIRGRYNVESRTRNVWGYGKIIVGGDRS